MMTLKGTDFVLNTRHKEEISSKFLPLFSIPTIGPGETKQTHVDSLICIRQRR